MLDHDSRKLSVAADPGANAEYRNPYAAQINTKPATTCAAMTAAINHARFVRGPTSASRCRRRAIARSLISCTAIIANAIGTKIGADGLARNRPLTARM